MKKPIKDFSKVRESDTIDLYFKWSVYFLVIVLLFGPVISAMGGI